MVVAAGLHVPRFRGEMEVRSVQALMAMEKHVAREALDK